MNIRGTRRVVLVAVFAIPLHVAQAQQPVDPAEIQRLLEAGEDPPALALVDGLHVTGSTIRVDIETYRLSVTGAVDRPLSLSIGEIESLEPTRVSLKLECPGFFVDYGTWTGVRVADVLALAGARETARSVRFTSIDGSYSIAFTIGAVRGGQILLAYRFNDKPFAPYHGFPLRVAAEGYAGYHWVKWLGSVEVLE